MQKTTRKLKRRNKQEMCLEDEKKGRKPRLKELDYEGYAEELKTTSPRKVKVGSNIKNRKILSNSPSLKRLKPLNLPKVLPRTNFIQNELKNSPTKFKKLLSSWEVFSKKPLTPAVNLPPKLAKFTDSQSGKCLENVRVENQLKMLRQPSESSLDAKVEASPKSGSSANEMGLKKNLKIC